MFTKENLNTLLDAEIHFSFYFLLVVELWNTIKNINKVTFYEREITFSDNWYWQHHSPWCLFNWKLKILARVLSNSKLARCSVKIFRSFDNMGSSSALFWIMHNATLASLERLSNLLLLIPGILFWKRWYHKEHQYGT